MYETESLTLKEKLLEAIDQQPIINLGEGATGLDPTKFTNKEIELAQENGWFEGLEIETAEGPVPYDSTKDELESATKKNAETIREIEKQRNEIFEKEWGSAPAIEHSEKYWNLRSIVG